MSKYVSTGERRAENVLSFPALQAIPVPSLPLKGVAQDKYIELARSLLNTGKLNIHTQALCEQVGVLHAEQHRRIEAGRPVAAASFERLNKLMRELRLVDASESVAPVKGAEENRFAKFGTHIRRRA